MYIFVYVLPDDIWIYMYIFIFIHSPHSHYDRLYWDGRFVLLARRMNEGGVWWWRWWWWYKFEFPRRHERTWIGFRIGLFVRYIYLYICTYRQIEERKVTKLPHSCSIFSVSTELSEPIFFFFCSPSIDTHIYYIYNRILVKQIFYLFFSIFFFISHSSIYFLWLKKFHQCQIHSTRAQFLTTNLIKNKEKKCFYISF